MRRTALSLATGISMALAAGAASAQDEAGYSLEDYNLTSSQDLLDICSIPPDHPDHFEATAFCYGFFEGGMHLHDALALAEDFPNIACPPEEATRAQAAAVFVTYARAHPEFQQEPPMETIFRAFVDKWPCGS